MTWISDLTRAFTSKNKTGWVKQGLNWKIPRKRGESKNLMEIYSPEGFQAGGKFTGKKVGGSVGGFTRGFGQGLWEGTFSKGMPKVLDVGNADGGGDGLVNITIPDFPKIPTFPKITIPDFPKLKIPEGGLVQIPKDILGGMDMPFGGLEMPSFEAFDEEGAPNYLVLGGLALVAYTVLKGDL